MLISFSPESRLSDDEFKSFIKPSSLSLGRDSDIDKRVDRESRISDERLLTSVYTGLGRGGGGGIKSMLLDPRFST